MILRCGCPVEMGWVHDSGAGYTVPLLLCGVDNILDSCAVLCNLCVDRTDGTAILKIHGRATKRCKSPHVTDDADQMSIFMSLLFTLQLLRVLPRFFFRIPVGDSMTSAMIVS